MERVLKRNLLVRTKTIETRDGRREGFIIQKVKRKNKPINLLFDLGYFLYALVKNMDINLVLLNLRQLHTFRNLMQLKDAHINQVIELGLTVSDTCNIMNAVFRDVWI